MPQFNRKCQVQIDGLTGDPTTNSVLIEGPRVAFHVEKTSTSTSNKINVKIYNLSKATRDRINDGGKSILTIRAGYVGDTKLLQVTKCYIDFLEHRSDGTEIITEMDCSDGRGILNNTKIAVTYAPNSHLLNILKDIIQESKWTLAPGINIDTLPIENKVLKKYAFNGLTKDALDELAHISGQLAWGVTDNVVYFADRYGAPGTQAVVLINAQTGMIGIPEKTNKRGTHDRIKRKKDGTDEEQPGYLIKSLLKPLVQPTSVIKLESVTQGIDQAFKVDSVEHIGDTHGDDWFSNIKVLL